MQQSEIPSKIVGIQFSLFSPEEIEKQSVVEITNKETYVGLKPKIGGLFDPRMGVLEPGMLCPTDGKNYIHSPGYFGHIKLIKPVFYIQYLDTIIDIMKCVCTKCGKLRISKKSNQFLAKESNKKRWKQVLDMCKPISRCGDENENGCGCKQPEKIRKSGFSNIVATWSDENAGENMQLTFTPEMVIRLFKKISDEDVNFMGFSNLWSRPEWMVCQIFAVPPPSMRPSVKHDAQQRSEDDLTHIIINIIKMNNKLKQIIQSTPQEELNTESNTKIINDWTQVLQYYIATMVDNKISGASPVTQRSGRALKSISERHKGKTGRVRGNLMGKRVDFSARSVITPDPELSIAELGVPLKVAKNITKPVEVQHHNFGYLSYLVKNGPYQYPGAKIIEKKSGISISLGYVDKENIKLEIGDIVHRHMLDGDYVLFNRQPTLHRMSMMAHIVKVMHHGDTFRMNVADTKPYNADFDGDEMNMHMPQSDEAEAELRYIANVPNQIVSPGNNKPIISIFQDSMIGSFLFTEQGKEFTKKQAMNLLMKTNMYQSSDLFKTSKKTYTNFEILSQILPKISLHFRTDLFKSDEDPKTSNRVLEIKNGEITRGQFDKGVLGSSSKGILHRALKDYNVLQCQYFIDNLQNIITEFMKTEGFSVGISDLIADDTTNQNIEGIISGKKKEVINLMDQIHLGIFENKTGKSNVDYFETQVNNILNKASMEAGNVGIGSLDKDNRFVSLVTSGSKGNKINISQMISCLGQQNVDGKRIPYGYTNRTLPHFKQFDDTPKARGFVESSFIGGLTPDELFFHAMGGRIGLIDTAVKTSTTGYIQRRLIKSMEDIQVMYDRTIRNNQNKIIQFNYGGTNFDTTHIESIKFELLDKDVHELYERYSYDLVNDLYDSAESVKSKSISKHLKFIYEASKISTFKSELEELKKKAFAELSYLIESRNTMIEQVYDHQNENKIYLPIHFMNLIENVKNRFGITSSSLSNMTPLEAYKVLESKYAVLEHMFQPCEKFKIVFTYYMNPFHLIHIHKYHEDALHYLCETMIHMYKKAVVNPGEMVGMISAQSIGEPTTQMTLNTFHYAGVSSKSNVTRGVPRIEEILTLTKKLKNPSLTIFLKDKDYDDKHKAYKIASYIEHTRFVDLIDKAEIYYEPQDTSTLVVEDDTLMQEYLEFSDIIQECYQETETKDNDEVNEDLVNKWIIRMEMNETTMFDMGITNEDLHYTLKTHFGNEISCFYSDYNSNEKMVFRIRPESFQTKKKDDSFIEEDYIYYVKTFMEKVLNDIVIRGVKNIQKVNLREIKGYKEYDHENGNYKKKDIYVLDTIGTNLLDILSMKNIDVRRTFSNDIMEMYSILGIEAARKCLFNEILDVMEFDSTYINHHHIHLLCDRMTCNEKMVSIFRHGINKDDIGPIAKASFEETTEMFLQAAKHGELDNMRGVSANIMCGQEGFYGTSAFQLYVDTPSLFEKYKSLPDRKENSRFEEEQETFDMEGKTPEEVLLDFKRKQENEYDSCSVHRLKMDQGLSESMVKNTIIEQEDDGFDLDI